MKNFVVKPGYHEWNVFLNNEILYSDEDPVEYLFGEPDPYSYEDYVGLILDYMKCEQQSNSQEDSNINYSLLNTLSERDYKKLGVVYVQALKHYYGEQKEE